MKHWLFGFRFVSRWPCCLWFPQSPESGLEESHRSQEDLAMTGELTLMGKAGGRLQNGYRVKIKPLGDRRF